MALNNISRSFKDISLSFSRNPVTNDILILRNEDAIKKSVMNLVQTQIGERFYNDLIGSNVNTLLFEMNLEDVTEPIKEQIRNLLQNFEPRIRVTNIGIISELDSNEVNIQISYDIVGLPFPTQTIQFLLQSSRL